MTWTTPNDLLNTLAERFGISVADICAGRRTTYRSRIRHVAAALLHESRYLSHSDIARILNYGDHTGAAAAVQHGRQLLATDSALAALVADLRTPALFT